MIFSSKLHFRKCIFKKDIVTQKRVKTMKLNKKLRHDSLKGFITSSLTSSILLRKKIIVTVAYFMTELKFEKKPPTNVSGCRSLRLFV